MTDREFKAKILAEIERLHREVYKSLVFNGQAKFALDRVVDFINSLPEEPVCDNRKEAVLKKAHELANRAELISDKFPKSTLIAVAIDMAEWCDSHPIEEPISEDFEQALEAEWKGYVDRGAATVDALEDNTQELAFAKGFYRGAQWQKLKIIYKAIIYNDKIYPTTYEDEPTEFCLDGGEEVRLITEAVNNGLLKQGDKVKVIIIKDE